MNKVAKYLARYHQEDSSFFVCKLSDNQMKHTVQVDHYGLKGVLLVDENRVLTSFPHFLQYVPMNDVLHLLKELDVDFQSIDMFPMYKLPEVDSAIYVCVTTDEKYYF